jgi:hypothetical protein
MFDWHLDLNLIPKQLTLLVKFDALTNLAKEQTFALVVCMFFDLNTKGILNTIVTMSHAFQVQVTTKKFCV